MVRNMFVLAFSFLLIGFSNYCPAEGLIPIQEVFEPSGSFDPDVYGKVAVLQWVQPKAAPLNVNENQAEAVKANNREIIADYIREAVTNGAQMVITPEFATVGYPYHPDIPSEEDNFLNREEIKPYVEIVPGPTTDYFSTVSRELGVYIHIGLAEVDEKTDKYYNTVVAFGPTGNIISVYRKIHLFKGERNYLSPGNKPEIYESSFGRVAIAICSDIYSNNPMDVYRSEKADVLAISTSWAQWNTGMTSFQKAATRVVASTLAANQTYFPDSGVINSDGSKQSHIRQSTGLAYGYLRYHTKR